MCIVREFMEVVRLQWSFVQMGRSSRGERIQGLMEKGGRNQDYSR